MAHCSELKELLEMPSFDVPWNLTMFVRSRMYYEKWVQHFFAKGEASSRGKLIIVGKSFKSGHNKSLRAGTPSMGLTCPYYRLSGSVYMHWTYGVAEGSLARRLAAAEEYAASK
eukprot:GHVU01092358.1.p2 GENE.GHVU01092358.1~~GHVU01092358.1.p2  ORF type:complete len:114 (+),score=15.33 GHVU01092358.1:230-571(+)